MTLSCPASIDPARDEGAVAAVRPDDAGRVGRDLVVHEQRELTGPLRKRAEPVGKCLPFDNRPRIADIKIATVLAPVMLGRR
jgi:hypothetical protein